MSFTVKDPGGSGNWTPINPGVYHGICYALVDLGTQWNEMYQKANRQCWISWELPFERVEIEGEKKPCVISKFYTVSLHEKSTLRKDLESWRGRGFSSQELQGFDISTVIGANCQLNVIHKPKKQGGNRAVISAIMPLTKGIEIKQSETEHIYFSWEEHGKALPENIPDGIKSMIMRSMEFNETGQQPAGYGEHIDSHDPFSSDYQPPGDYDDDIPF